MKPSTSITRLTLIGFLLVVLPLIASVVSTLRHTDRLAMQLQKAMLESTQVVEAARSIRTDLLNMARSAGQYWVLADPDILERYKEQRNKLEETIYQLDEIASDETLSERLQQILKQENTLYDRLREMPEEPNNKPQELEEIQLMTSLIRPLPFEVTLVISERSSAVNAQLMRVHRMLLWQALALIPLTVVLAVVFSILITRPLHRLRKAINLLGGGEFTKPVVVNGPQDIRELGVRLDWLRQRLAGLDEQKLLFLQHVSHELKTPLTAIREGTDLLQEKIIGPLNREQLEVVQILRDSGLQLQAQVEALLDFNTALAQETPLQPEPLSLDDLLKHTVQQHRLAARNRNISFDLDIESVKVEGDREQLRIMLSNLVSNAVKYSLENEAIHLRLRTDNENAILDVIDSGPSIEAEEQDRIFEPFYQGRHLPSGFVKGTGLGLAIAQRYTRMHHGELQIVPFKNGAHFRLTLPQKNALR